MGIAQGGVFIKTDLRKTNEEQREMNTDMDPAVIGGLAGAGILFLSGAIYVCKHVYAKHVVRQHRTKTRFHQNIRTRAQMHAILAPPMILRDPVKV